MTCDLDISTIKANSIIIIDENGLAKCVNKEDFLKDFKDEIKKLQLANEQLAQAFNRFVSSEKEENQLFKNAIYTFIKILKGEPKCEK